MKNENITRDNNKYIGKYQTNNIIYKHIVKKFYNVISGLIIKINDNIDSVLEVGCGHGISTKIISKSLKGKHFEASDIDEEGFLLADAKKHNPAIQFKRESIYCLERKNNEFDLVISLEVLEHLDDYKKGLEELERVTTNYCLTSVPCEPLWRILNVCRGKYLSRLGNTPGHVNNWSKKEYAEIISEYFDIIEIKNPLPWTIILAKKKT